MAKRLPASTIFAPLATQLVMFTLSSSSTGTQPESYVVPGYTSFSSIIDHWVLTDAPSSHGCHHGDGYAVPLLHGLQPLREETRSTHVLLACFFCDCLRLSPIILYSFHSPRCNYPAPRLDALIVIALIVYSLPKKVTLH